MICMSLPTGYTNDEKEESEGPYFMSSESWEVEKM